MTLGLSQTIIELTLVNVILALSAFVVVAGGTFSFAFVAFIGLGAYTGAIMATEHGLGLLPALVLAPAIAMIAAAILAKPLERLTGVYLAMVTVAIMAVFEVVLLNMSSVTGGALGITGIGSGIGLLELGLAVAALLLAFRMLQHSMLGRAMRLVRADPLVASAMGVNVPRLQLLLFVASAGIGALGGVLRAYYFGFVVPGDYSFALLIRLLAMVILGGVGHWSGALIGAFVMTVVPDWLRPFGEWRDIATGGIVLLIIVLLPQGVTGGLTRLRRILVRRRRGEIHEEAEDAPATGQIEGELSIEGEGAR